jgi:hypothetical protein
MKSHIAIYKTHADALKAVETLFEQNFPIDQVSLVGNASIEDNHIQVKSLGYIRSTPMLIAIIIGLFVGTLAGMVDIPGLGFLFGSNLLFGTLFGFDLGLIIGVIAIVITSFIVKKRNVVKYKEHLVQKKFFVIVNGSVEDITKAEQILHSKGLD